METHEANQIRYEALVDRLIENFNPAKRLWPITARLTLWLALEVCILLVGLATRRPDLSEKLGSLTYLMEIAIFIVTGTVAAALALRTSIPGREATNAELALISACLVAAGALILLEPAVTNVTLDEFIAAGISCALFTILFAALPWLALFWAVRRGATLVAGTAGALTGAAAFSFAFAVGQLRCPIENSLHLLTWHMLPGLIGVALSVLAGTVWLGRRDAQRRLHRVSVL